MAKIKGRLWEVCNSIPSNWGFDKEGVAVYNKKQEAMDDYYKRVEELGERNSKGEAEETEGVLLLGLKGDGSTLEATIAPGSLELIGDIKPLH